MRSQVKTVLWKCCHERNTVLQLLSSYVIPVRMHAQMTSFQPSLDDETSARSDVKPFEALPGPKGLKAIPFIGTMFMLKPFGQYTVDTLGHMLNDYHDQYGPIYRARMGRDWVVYVERLEDIEKAFRHEGACPRRPLIALHKIYQERTGKPHSLTTVEGEAWRRLRTPLNQRMNKPNSAAYYLPIQNDVADDFVAMLADNSLSPAQLKETFFKFATELIGVVCFNRRLGFLSPDLQSQPAHKLLECFKVRHRCTAAAMMGREFKYLFYEDAFYRQYKRVTDYIISYATDALTELLEEVKRRQREGTWDENEPNLVLSLLAEPSLGIPDVLGVLEPLLTAAAHSTASGLQMLLYNLSRNPDQQEALASELASHVTRSQPITAQHLAQLKYLAASIKESLRLIFPLPTGVARILPVDVVLSGYNIPKGTTVGISSQRTVLSATYFPNARHFRPERFLRNEEGKRETTISGFAHLPFGFGPRNCIGRRFAEQELTIAAAKIIRNFRVSLPVEFLKGEMEKEYHPFVSPKQPLPFIFQPRD